MKNKLLFLSLLSCSILGAQNDFNAEQRFNRAPGPKPLIGFDLLRKQNPLMIIQVKDAGDNWVNNNKYVTQSAPFSPNVYSEIGTYDYDGTTNSWKVNTLNTYIFDYDATRQRVVEARSANAIIVSGYQGFYKYSYTFADTGNLPDSEYVTRQVDGVFQPYYNNAFTYNAEKKLTRQVYTYLSGFWYVNDLTYNSSGQLIGELSLSSGPGSQTMDSSIRVTYTYDAQGRLEWYTSEIYELPTSPHKWTTNKKVHYIYDNNNRVIEDHVWGYNYQGDFEEVPSLDHYYHYSGTGKLIEYIQTDYATNGDFETRDKVIFFYDQQDHAETAFEYPWNAADSSFDSLPSFRYLFRYNTGISDRHADITPALYPNPSNGELNIHYRPGTPATCTITDISGKTVHTIQLTQSQHRADISMLQPGVYFVHVDSGKPVKLLKQ